MNGRAIKLGTFAKPDGKPFTAIVLDDSAVDLAQAAAAFGRKKLATETGAPMNTSARSNLRLAVPPLHILEHPKVGMHLQPARESIASALSKNPEQNITRGTARIKWNIRCSH